MAVDRRRRWDGNACRACKLWLPQTCLTPPPPLPVRLTRPSTQWDVLTDEEACEVVRAQLQSAGGSGRGASQPPPLDGRLATMAAESLVQLALVKGTMDNVTAVVMLLQWD